MKFALAIFAIALLLGNQHGNCQGAFQNLDFEAANVPDVPSNTDGGTVTLTSGMPGWTAIPVGLLGTNLVIGHNTFSAGGAVVAIEGPQLSAPAILDGNYTAYLQGSTFGTPTSAYIAQTGQIPLGSESLQFFASPSANFQLSTGGQVIPTVELGSTPNYDIMSCGLLLYPTFPVVF